MMLVTIDAARKALAFCDSYSRMEKLVGLSLEMAATDWQTVLGEEWSCCDNVGAHRLTLRKLLPSEGPVTPMMTADELAAYNGLPELLTVYRGCGEANMLGASWSLSREVAARFPLLHRYRQPRPLLITAQVKRRRVLAVKLDRNEAEVITFAARRVRVEQLATSA